jgi:hypothetical protein
MADIIMDGRVKVWSVPTIANIAAPTTAELNAGTSLGGLLTKDGLQGFSPDTAAVDTTALNSVYGTNLPGLADLAPGALRFKAQTSPDTIKTTFVKDYATNIVIRRDGTLETSAWGSGQKVEVWPVVCGYRKDGDMASNEVQKYDIPVFFNLQPNQNATTT